MLAGLLVFAAPASATFHLMKIREVYPAGNASYVELQMLNNGEYQVASHHLVTYASNGAIVDDFVLPNNGSPTSRTNATILIGGSGYAAAFPSGPSLDEFDSAMSLSASGGAVCWVEGEPPDCVAWGNFTGPLPSHTPPLVVGNPASPGGVTAGKALQRSITAGCATRLEAGDDTDDSATDFSEHEPEPRKNTDPIVEVDCELPDVSIESKPANPTNSTSAEFKYSSSPEGAQFECSLDGAPPVDCTIPDDAAWVYPGPLADGSHTFEVVGENSQGPGAATTYTWLVDTVAPTVAITSGPANGSPGDSVTFDYAASQLGSSLQCSLVRAGEADSFVSCPATTRTYEGLADGAYVFKARATDKAGNQGPAAEYRWEAKASSSMTPPVVPPASGSSAPPTAKPRKKSPRKALCKKGFAKKKVKRKSRCVKKHKKKHKKH